ncbi:hypothetical protein [Burkholderia sp. MBR-1]|uniref:hypothetical protein n=1 Tax=Burkholderia sp. MBR-1 TaxID=2732364 RepID=UPI0015EF287E|nr:hypothetical protein [Burkholderia sp. MBR-1]QMI49906.1 hypothetical protein MBR110_31090 [Burkholderia sp. MBR-1]
MRTYHNTGTLSASVSAPPPPGFRLVTRWESQCVKLDQRTNKAGRFRVTYGLEVEDKLTYADACWALDAALMHSLTCDGALNNGRE